MVAETFGIKNIFWASATVVVIKVSYVSYCVCVTKKTWLWVCTLFFLRNKLIILCFKYRCFIF